MRVPAAAPAAFAAGGVAATSGLGDAGPQAHPRTAVATSARRMVALCQRDVLLDHEIRWQSLDLESRPRLQGLDALEVPRGYGSIHTLLDLALRRDAEVLEEVPDG